MPDVPAPAVLSPLRFLAPDGVALAAHVGGTPQGAEVLFIHGFSQCGLCWSLQTGDPALAHLRLATCDLRGQGASDKPLDERAYKDPRIWADDLKSVIEGCGLRRPVLVGWSYAGRVICDYLAAYGTTALSGIVFVDAVGSNARELYGSCNKLMRQMCSADVAENVAATRAFLARCTARPLSRDAFETALAYNMLVPPQVRAGLFGRPAEYDDVLAAIDVPTLVVQGEKDEVIAPAMAPYIAARVPGAELWMLPDSGHAPFLDEPGLFNARLADFVARAWQAEVRR